MRSNEAKTLIRYIEHSKRLQAIELLDYIIDIENILASCFDSISKEKLASFQIVIDRHYVAIQLLANRVN
jgi:hypothetical protein